MAIENQFQQFKSFPGFIGVTEVAGSIEKVIIGDRYVLVINNEGYSGFVSNQIIDIQAPTISGVYFLFDMEGHYEALAAEIHTPETSSSQGSYIHEGKANRFSENEHYFNSLDKAFEHIASSGIDNTLIVVLRTMILWHYNLNRNLVLDKVLSTLGIFKNVQKRLVANFSGLSQFNTRDYKELRGDFRSNVSENALRTSFLHWIQDMYAEYHYPFSFQATLEVQREENIELFYEEHQPAGQLYFQTRKSLSPELKKGLAQGFEQLRKAENVMHVIDFVIDPTFINNNLELRMLAYIKQVCVVDNIQHLVFCIPSSYSQFLNAFEEAGMLTVGSFKKRDIDYTILYSATL